MGFLGSCFFIGIICSILWVPKVADTYGRVPCIISALTLQIIAQSGVYLSTNLRLSQFFLFILGMTFPGKNIIWYNYQLEMTKESYKQFSVNFIVISETLAIIAVSLFYQFIDTNWKTL